MCVMNGIIFNIQRFSTHDGPGLRTTVFFKGCNLRCSWCHNPESIDGGQKICYTKERCIGCKKCISLCKDGALTELDGRILLNAVDCTYCGRCINECYSGALSTIGRELSKQELVREISSDMMYYQNCETGGGVTFSGGECMLQVEFLKEVLIECKDLGIHTAIDTAGNVPYQYFEKINSYVDLYLYDVKVWDNRLHRELTGVPNQKILFNLEQLLSDGKEVQIRVPVIPGANVNDLKDISLYLKKLQIEEVKLLPYHNMGISKRDMAGKSDIIKVFTEPGDKEMNQYKEEFLRSGVMVVE